MRVIWIAAAALVCISAAWGCGGEDDGDDGDRELRVAAVAAAEREATEDAFSQVPIPDYLDAEVGKARAEVTRTRVQGPGAFARGRVRAKLVLKPKPHLEEFLRVVPAEGGSVTLSRPFTVDLTRQGEDGKWRVAGDGAVEFDQPDQEELSPEEQEQARKLAVDAVTALLTFDGDKRAYAREQAGFYATKVGSAADFNQPGFDPPPALADRRFGDIVDTAWERTNDGGDDDRDLDSAFGSGAAVIEPEEFDCNGHGIRLRTMKPKTVSGKPNSSRAGAVEDGVAVSGQAVVELGDKNCEERTLDDDPQVRGVGPFEGTLEYQALVSRLLFGEGDWYISALTVGQDVITRPGEYDALGSGEPNLYATGETAP